MHYVELTEMFMCLIKGKKGKGKDVPMLFLTEHHAKKAYWWSGDIVLHILALSTTWK